MKSCFFIGHREAPSTIFPSLAEAVEHHIADFDVTEFIVGNYGAFDRMAARALAEAKVRHLEISVMLLTPYHPAQRHVEAPPGFDGIFYPPGMETVPYRLCVVRANRYMAEHVDYLIAYVWHPASNAQKMLEYALKKKVAVMNLGDLHSDRLSPAAVSISKKAFCAKEHP